MRGGASRPALALCDPIHLKFVAEAFGIVQQPNPGRPETVQPAAFDNGIELRTDFEPAAVRPHCRTGARR